MYNLSVAVAETYYVGEGQWLVHNCDNNWSGVISPERAQHILYGDAVTTNPNRVPNPQQIPGVAGHMSPGGPGQTPFPASWGENQILNNVADILTSDKTTWYLQSGNNNSLYTNAGRPAIWVAWEVRDGVTIKVVFEPATGRIATSHPQALPAPNNLPKANRGLW